MRTHSQPRPTAVGRRAVCLVLLAASALGVAAAPAGATLTAITPDGKVVIARNDGTGKRVLAPGYRADVSPDGATVAVTAFDAASGAPLRTSLYASSGGAPMWVTDVTCGSLFWSPDSTKLACFPSINEDDPANLVLIDAVSGATATLATGFFDRQGGFAPGSLQLAYVELPRPFPRGRAGTLKRIDLATKEVTTIRAAAASPVWGPTAIAFSTVSRRAGRDILNVALIQPDGTSFRQVTRFRPDIRQGLWGLEPRAFSANGARLLGRLWAREAGTIESYAIDPVRGGFRLLASGITSNALTPDGRYLIGCNGNHLDRAHTWRVPWSGGKQRVLLRRACAPSLGGP